MNAKGPPHSSFENYRRALKNLERSLSAPVTEPRDLSGIIKDFEMTYELSWKVLKKILKEAGHDTQGAKDVYSTAFKLSYIDQEATWLEMIQDRNQSSHVYEEKDAKEIANRVKKKYLGLFQGLLKKLP